jgi:hypothetical protein
MVLSPHVIETICASLSIEMFVILDFNDILEDYFNGEAV